MILPQAYLLNEQLLHTLSQFIARVGKAYIPPKPDDSHTNLAWEPETGCISGHPIPAPLGNFTLAIELKTFSVLLRNADNQAICRVKAAGMRDDQLLEVIRNWMQETGLDGQLLEYPLHFSIPVYGPGVNFPYPSSDKDSLETWAKMRTLANEALFLLNDAFSLETPIRIWPHHFDTGVYYQLNKDDSGKTNRSIGAGLAIADDLLDEPYFYMYGWKESGSLPYDEKPNLTYGYWLVQDKWKGALLPHWEWSANGNHLERVATFFEEVGNWMRTELTGKALIMKY